MEVGDRPANVRLLTQDGEELDLSEFRGSPVVLTFLRYIG